MPIYRLFETSAFEPEHCQAMGLAFEGILQELGLKNRNDPLCDVIAATIIKLGHQGVRNPKQLHDMALKSIRE